MLKTLRATVRQGKIELLEQAELPEGTEVLVTLLSEAESGFWLQTSQSSLDTIWHNAEDDIYVELLQNDIVLVRYPFSDKSSFTGWIVACFCVAVQCKIQRQT